MFHVVCCIILLDIYLKAVADQLTRLMKRELRTSDTVNGSHNVSLPMILKKNKVGQFLQSSCRSSLLVPIL